MRRTLVALAVLLAPTVPAAPARAPLPDHVPDPAAGELAFWLGGCASCHATPVDGKRARGEDKLLLGGGMDLPSPYGTFVVPNISPHEDGIGGWSMPEFVDAMQRGVAPDGRHYYPSFPYASYVKADVKDIMDLKAYLDTLPAVPGRSADHSLRFPWSVRRGIGMWKRRNLDASPVIEFDGQDPLLERGRALVEGLGHCGECHTPRRRFGGLETDRWLAWAPNPEGEGRIPNITPAGKNVRDWSAADIAYYLGSGFTPDFDTVGGSMVAVQENLARLPADDLQAIAAYLKAVPAVE
ncbi:MAG: cytochrome c [Proteobacteria bacterium]|nr:cytochrome c [Pseudomonadota bacterium]